MNRFAQALKRRVRDFRQTEDGSMVVFTLFILAMMMMVGGLAVDIMRFESYRARLQTTLDRAVLAAADLDVCVGGSNTPQEIVNDYVAKAGFENQLTDVQVQSSLTSCSVAVTAQINVNTIFMQMVGVDNLGTGAASRAIEAVSDIEISLVLDVSGSMGSNNRIANMRNAARDFNEVMFSNFDEAGLTMSVVPYSTNVNLGPALASTLNRSYAHDYSYCLNLPVSSYDTTAFDPNATYEQTAHVDIDSYAYYWSQRGATRFMCNPSASAHVLPFASSETQIDTMIAGLQPNEWTSIEMGAKWGVSLLDPSVRPIVTELAAAGHVNSSDTAGRPLDYNAGNNLKVLVLMTDGENTRHYELDDNYKSGLSDVWRVNSSTYYVQDEEQGNYDYDYSYWEDYYRPQNDDFTNSVSGTRLTWPELWNEINLDAHAWYFRRNQTNNNSVWNNWYYGLYDTVTTNEKDDRLDRICTQAKNQGIVIFTIAFEATSRAADVMEACASSPSHFYDVDGLEISSAFASIASNITQLRLVQ